MEFEPHFITSSTKVVQPNNHTLTAVWEPNQYEVTLNPYGGEVSSSTQTVTYGSRYNNLPHSGHHISSAPFPGYPVRF